MIGVIYYNITIL